MAELQEKSKISIEDIAPKMHCVIFHNDDKTTMQFVIEVLMQVFDHSAGAAFDLMMKIHNEGAARVGTFAEEIAEMKVDKTLRIAQINGQPLRVTHESE